MKRFILLLVILTCCSYRAAFAQDSMGLTPPSPTMVAESQGGYLLAPGDQIKVTVLGEPQFNFEAEVNENGMIEVPFFDNQPINAMCRNAREIKGDVVKLLSKYLRNPQVSLDVTSRKSRLPVIVNGQVRQPSQVVLYRKARLLELISTAGGVTEDASGIIQVFRTQAPICGSPEEVVEWKAQAENNGGVVSNIYSYSSLRTGSLDANPLIYPGDFIVVTKALPVYFTGEIRSPQNLQIPEGGLSLFQAIAMLGGVNREAKTKDIKIYRLKANSQDREIISVNYSKIKSGEQKDVMLAPYDVVEVDKSKKSIGQTILELATGVGKSGIQYLGIGLPQKILY